jgi:hypothetical protein
MKRIVAALATGLLLGGVAEHAQANLLKNSSFELVPSAATGQGILPEDWINVPTAGPGADTYSNDGSYGLAPSANGNFTGVTAYDGIRWVAGWSVTSQESFGQWLDAPLVAGNTYYLSGWLHQALRSDLDFTGGYQVYLTNTPSVHTEYLGFLGATSSTSAGWEQFSISFAVTPVLASLNFLEFVPVVTATTGSAYPGLDLVSLTKTETASVPEPSTIFLIGAGLFGLAGTRVVRKQR